VDLLIDLDLGRLLAFPANIRLEWKCLAVTHLPEGSAVILIGVNQLPVSATKGPAL
jgi:hypothetical protein